MAPALGGDGLEASSGRLSLIHIFKTYVTAREDSLVREVLTRELARGGQVFFVHNRVQSIDREAQRLRDLVPEARVAVAHGQMHEDLLASVMRAFVEGEVLSLIHIYEKPSVRRKRKLVAARKRRAKAG